MASALAHVNNMIRTFIRRADCSIDSLDQSAFLAACLPDIKQPLLICVSWPVCLCRKVPHEADQAALISRVLEVAADKPEHGRCIEETSDVAA
jgi:hypothetical protein